MADPALDPAVLDNLRQLNQDGEPDVVREVLGLFVSDAPRRLNAMADAVTRLDAGEVQRTAHALKGASASIGAFALQRLCRELEELARGEDLSTATATLDYIVAEYARVKAAIDDVLKAA